MQSWPLQSCAFGVAATLLGLVPAVPAELVSVRILAINDFHGHLEAGDNAIQVADPERAGLTLPLRAGGAAWLAAWIPRLRADQPNHVLVSSGDLVGASPLTSGLFYDEPTIEVMNAIGLDLNAAGNHEFDRGTDELLRLARGGCHSGTPGPRMSCAGPSTFSGAAFPVVSANVVQRTTGP